jgi:hypothetical protein
LAETASLLKLRQPPDRYGGDREGDIEVIDHTAWSTWIIRTAANLRQRFARPEATVLVSVDQLEEVFLGRTAVVDAFLLGLRGALTTSDHRLLALATLRADFAGPIALGKG